MIMSIFEVIALAIIIIYVFPKIVLAIISEVVDWFMKLRCEHDLEKITVARFVDTSKGAKHDQVTYKRRGTGHCTKCETKVSWTMPA